jgi:hypothetical protein
MNHASFRPSSPYSIVRVCEIMVHTSYINIFVRMMNETRTGKAHCPSYNNRVKELCRYIYGSASIPTCPFLPCHDVPIDPGRPVRLEA